MFELSLNKLCKAPVGRVFAAWSTPEQLQRWFAPGELSVPQADVDFRVGGAYRIVMRRHDGQHHIIGGVYREIVPNERLCFTWCWEGSEVTTDVEITFRPAGEQTELTELTLTHRQFPTEEMRDKHKDGWEGSLVKLVQLD
ncbi:MAG: SRPBCC domain-containing protein [Pseudomonadota bacterium]